MPHTSDLLNTPSGPSAPGGPPHPLALAHTRAAPTDRRRWLARSAVAAWGFAGLGAGASPTWPLKPVQLIVPWPAGGGTDVCARVLADEAASRLGQQVVVINRPGAAGTLVAPLLKAAAPDGHTIGQLPLPVLRHALMHKVPWDPLQDTAPILQIATTSFGLLVPAASPWHSVQEVLDWARAHPGALMMGSTGTGSTPHLAMEDLMASQQLSYTHVPYKGTADQMLALASGHILAAMNSSGFAPWVEQGRVRVLALFSEQRSARWPQVPTMKELGFAAAVYRSPWGLVAPAGTPTGVMRVLHDAFRAALFAPRHVAELQRHEQELSYLDGAAYRQALLASVQHERKLLQRMKLLAAE